MATRAQIVQALAKRRQNSYYTNLTREMIKQAAQQLTDAEWDEIIEGVKASNASRTGEPLMARVQFEVEAKAVQDIEDRLGVDDTLTIAELQDLF